MRFRCEDCRKMVRVHPVGVAAGQRQSHPLQVLSGLLYPLGLGYYKRALVLDLLGCGVAKSTIRENLQALGQAAGRGWQPQGRRPVLRVDETRIKVKGADATTTAGGDPRR